MFASRKQRIGIIFNNSEKIAKTYKRINQERERMEGIIKKWQRLGTRIKKSAFIYNALFLFKKFRQLQSFFSSKPSDHADTQATQKNRARSRYSHTSIRHHNICA